MFVGGRLELLYNTAGIVPIGDYAHRAGMPLVYIGSAVRVTVLQLFGRGEDDIFTVFADGPVPITDIGGSTDICAWQIRNQASLPSLPVQPALAVHAAAGAVCESQVSSPVLKS